MLSVLFVDDGAAGGGDGLAWASAYNDLQDALVQAETCNTDGDANNDIGAIWIAEGTYAPSALLETGNPRSASFSLVDGVTLYGGFAGNETALEARDPAAHVTTLSGDVGVPGDVSDNAYTVVYCGTGVEAAVDGVSIAGGNADGEYGSHTETEPRLGGGIVNRGTLTLTGATVANNSAYDGAGLYNEGVVSITDSTFSGNTANQSQGSGAGGGIYNIGDLTVVGSTFWGNLAGGDGDCDSGGGGIWNSGAASVSNTTFWGNAAVMFGGGAICNYGALDVTNSTIAANSAGTFRDGGGILNDCRQGCGTLVLNNTIVAGNTGFLSPDIGLYVADASGSHNLIGDGSDQSVFIDGVDGNQVGSSTAPIYPLLSDWTQLDDGRWGYYLFPGSPAVDAGDDALAVDPAGQPLDEDIYGNPRIGGAAVDVGAAEGATAGTPAQTYVVTSLENTVASDGVLTFVEAFEAANRNQPVGDAAPGSFSERDVIQFAEGLSGTILVDDELAVLGNLSIDGPGADLLTFDANGQGRVFLIHSGAACTLDGITLTGGSADEGGGVLSRGDLTITDATIRENQAECGGGVYNAGGLLTISDSLITGNSTSVQNEDSYYRQGGGIYSSGDLQIVRCVVSENEATGESDPLGGGLYSESSGALIITDSLFQGNTALAGQGGALCAMHYFDLGFDTISITITGSAFVENEASVTGGLAIIGGAAVSNCTIEGNVGGGINSVGRLDIAGSAINGNTSDYPGGGIWNQEGLLNVTGCTIAGNSASDGGGIYSYWTNTGVSITNSIVALNSAVNDANIGGVVSAGSGYNLIGVTSPGFIRDPGPGGDGIWGTDDDDFGDVRLSATSPAIDGGDNGAIPQGTTVDLDGNPRIYGETVDIGAYEYQDAPASGRETPSTVVTTTSDTFDLYDGLISIRDAVFYATAGDRVTFDPALDGETITLDGSAVCLDRSITIDAGELDNLTIDADGKSGVIQNWADDAAIIGLTLTGGSSHFGGGIYNAGGLTVLDTTITGNWVYYCGGGIHNEGGTVAVIGSELLGNLAEEQGGGVYNYGGTMTITNTVVAGNSAAYYGGGLCNESGVITIADSTIAGNAAVWGEQYGTGGGIGNGGEITINNSIVAGNAAQTEIDLCLEGSFSGSHNLIGNGSGVDAFVDGENGNLVGTAETPVDPKFVRNPADGGDGWGDNPWTPDVDESANDDYGDLQLRSDSPAVDAGDDALLPADEFDLDGDGNTAEPIPYGLAGASRVQGERVDMGAYEYVAEVSIPGDLNGDGMVGSADLDIVRANWGQTVSPGSLTDGDPSGDGVVGSADLDVVRANWGQTAAAASASTSVATPVEEDTTEDAVYGPTRRIENASIRHQNLHTLADAAWANAVTALQTRTASREARAVADVMSDWGLVSP